MYRERYLVECLDNLRGCLSVPQSIMSALEILNTYPVRGLINLSACSILSLFIP